jgi:hypothetical protein
MSKSSPKVGDVVQIKDTVPRGSWKVGRIVQLVTSRDGNIRSAKIILPSKIVIGRPLNLLYPLETSEDLNVENHELLKSTDRRESQVVHRPYRKAAEIAKQRLKGLSKSENSN